MEFRAFAEQILFGKTLSDKLVGPADSSTGLLTPGASLKYAAMLTDHSPGIAFTTPKFPGRPQGLSLERSVRSESAPAGRFPGRNAFESEAGRGMILHFFANHELLALELMALALLKFPDAPPGFRRGIVQTMLEEQSHLMLYIQRMTELGVEFGQLPVNSFFWNCLSPMHSPMEYVSQMSMTFEQANVDFSAHYRDVFQQIGDETTANILDRVYREEIGHVKHGVSWFDKWRDNEQSQFDSWVANLTFPVTPSRARGIGFVVPARQAMGLSDDYIESLRSFSLSKGRQPKVYLFLPGFEEEVAEQQLITGAALEGTPSRKSLALLNVEADLSLLMAFFALQDDVVVAPVSPTPQWKESLKEFGFDLPHFISATELTGNSRRYAPSGYRAFHPWAWSQTSQSLLQPIAAQLLSTKSHTEAAKALWDNYCRLGSFAPVYASKEYLEKFFAEFNETTSICRSLDQVLESLSKLYDSGYRKALIKPALAASGRGHIPLISPESERSFTIEEIKIQQLLERQRSVIVEPLLDRVCDFSIQMTVHPDGRLQEHGIVRLICDGRGQYKGHILGKALAGLEKEVVVAAHRQDWFGKLRLAARTVGERLVADGYLGPFGIDSFAYRLVEPGNAISGFGFRPLVEINARYTMGRVACELERKITHGQTGIWRHLSRNELKRQGHDSFISFYNLIKKRGGERIFATNDPETAKLILSILAVGSSLSECEALLQPH